MYVKRENSTRLRVRIRNRLKIFREKCEREPAEEETMRENNVLVPSLVRSVGERESYERAAEDFPLSHRAEEKKNRTIVHITKVHHITFH